MPVSFLDSNVLLYFASGEPVKAERAEALMQEGGTISVQVLNEMALVMRRKFNYDWDRIEAVLATVRSAFAIVSIGVGTHERALRIARRHDLRVYDALIAAAALIAGCDTLWTEDMHDGLVIEGRLTVRNPFSGLH